MLKIEGSGNYLLIMNAAAIWTSRLEEKIRKNVGMSNERSFGG